MLKYIQNFKKILYNPYYVFIACLVFLSINLLVDKTFIQILKLSRDFKIVQNRVENVKLQNEKLKESIKHSSDKDFIEKEAREKLDFLNKGELIFIFPDNS